MIRLLFKFTIKGIDIAEKYYSKDAGEAHYLFTGTKELIQQLIDEKWRLNDH